VLAEADSLYSDMCVLLSTRDAVQNVSILGLLVCAAMCFLGVPHN
jgi:hypothetical protein